MGERIARTRELTDRPFGVNLFVPGPVADPDDVRRLRRRASKPRAWTSARRGPTTTTGTRSWRCSRREPAGGRLVHVRLPRAGRARARFDVAWVTVTSPEEARGAVEAGASALVVQGSEAGGHRGSWVDTPDLEPIGLHALLQLVDVDVPLVATGGIATAAAVQAVLALGARAAQVGTAFMRAPEAGTSQAHRDALASDDADGADARVQRPARARYPQPLPRGAPRRADRLPGDPLRRRRRCGRRRARTATRS